MAARAEGLGEQESGCQWGQFLWGGDKNALKLTVKMASQHSEYRKTNNQTNIKLYTLNGQTEGYVNCISIKLLNFLTSSKKLKREISHFLTYSRKNERAGRKNTTRQNK